MSNIRTLLEERLTAFDPTLDLSEGSQIYTQVIAPVVSRFDQDPLSTDTAEFLVRKVKESFPELSVSPGDALYDIVISATALFLDVYRNEVSKIKANQSITNLDSMTSDDVDALAANWLLERRQGSFAQGTVRVIFAQPRSVSFSAATLFTTATGISFRPVGAYTVSAETMLTNLINGDQYFVDVQVISLLPGISGNVSAGSIINAVGLDGVVSVRNDAALSGGADEESNNDLIRARLPRAITERSLVTGRGISARLDYIDARVLSTEVIGFGDTEMVRDQVPAKLVGAPIGIGIAITNKSTAVLCLRSLVRAPQRGDRVHLQEIALSPPGEAGFDEETLSIKDVRFYAADDFVITNTHTAIVDLDSTSSRTARFTAYALLLHEENSLEIAGEVVKNNDSLGGMVDVYIQPDSDEQSVAQVSRSEENIICRGVGTNFFANRIAVDFPQDNVILRDQYLVLGEGENVGTYRIIHTNRRANTLDIYVHKDFSIGSFPNQSWAVIAETIFPLNEEKEILAPLTGESLDVSLSIGRNEVSTNGVNLQNVGSIDGTSVYLVEEDLLLLISAIDQGRIVLAEASPLTYSGRGQIVRARQTISMPLSYVESVQSNNKQLQLGLCVGAEVLNMSSGSAISDGQGGCILPKFHFAEMLRPFIASSHMDADSYTLQSGVHAFMTAPNNGGQRHLGYRYTPISHGMAMPRESSVVVNAHFGQPLERGAATTDIENYVFNALLPAELFVPGEYNCFLGYGDLSKEEVLAAAEKNTVAEVLEALKKAVPANMPEPISGNPGDTLVIDNKGYIISRVYQLAIPLDRNEIHATYESEYPEGVSRYYETRVDSPQVLRLSIVVTRDSLPTPSTAGLEPGILVEYMPVGNDILSATEITLSSFLRLLLAPGQLYQENAFRLETAAALQRAEIQPSLQIATLPARYAVSDDKTYSVHRSAKGEARLYFDSPKHRRLPVPGTKNVGHEDIAEAIRRLGEDSLQEINLIRARAGFDLSNELVLSTDQRVYAPVINDDADIKNPETWSRSHTTRFVSQSIDALRSSYILDESSRFGSSTLGFYDIFIPEDKKRAAQDLEVGDELWLCPQNMQMPSTTPLTTKHPSFLLSFNLVALPAVPVDVVTVHPSSDFVQEWQLRNPGADPEKCRNFKGETVAEFAASLSTDTFFTLGQDGAQEEELYVSSGDFYSVSEVASDYSVPPMISTIGSSRAVKIEPRYDTETISLETATIPGSLLYVDGEQTNRVVSSSSSGDVVLRDAAVEGTAAISIRGYAVFNPAAKTLTLQGPTFRYEQDGSFALTPNLDNTHGVGTGGTTRFFNTGDVRRKITIAPIVYSDAENHAALDSFTTTVLRVQNDEEFSYDAGETKVYTQTITLQEEHTALTQALPDVDAIDVFFFVSDTTLDIHPVKQANFYDNSHRVFRVDAISRMLGDEAPNEGAVFIRTIGNETPSDIGQTFSRRGTLGVNVQSGAPAVFVRKDLVKITPILGDGLYYADVPVQSRGATYNSTALKSLDLVPSALDDGYTVHNDNVGLCFSQREKPYVRVPSVARIDGELTDLHTTPLEVYYRYSQVVANAQFRFSNSDERVVCSELLAKRMLPGFIDVSLSYKNGPNEDIVRQYVFSAITSAASRREGIRTGDLVHLIRRLGAESVSLPVIRLYVIDQRRNRLVKIIKDAFSLTDLVNYAGTARITSLSAPTESNALGLALRVQRT